MSQIDPCGLPFVINAIESCYEAYLLWCVMWRYQMLEIEIKNSVFITIKES